MEPTLENLSMQSMQILRYKSKGSQCACWSQTQRKSFLENGGHRLLCLIDPLLAGPVNVLRFFDSSVEVFSWCDTLMNIYLLTLMLSTSCPMCLSSRPSVAKINESNCTLAL